MDEDILELRLLEVETGAYGDPTAARLAPGAATDDVVECAHHSFGSAELEREVGKGPIEAKGIEVIESLL